MQPSVSLLADAPPGWEVVFEADSVVNLETEAIADIGLEITPPPDLVPGDYAITIRARNALVDESFDFRVTVSRTTIWGWVGIGIVVVVMGGLVGLFVRLGRR